MVPKFYWLHKAFLGVCALCFVPAIQAAPKLHRAVEPAQVMLDVIVAKNNLTLYLTISTDSLKWISSGVSSQTIVNTLSQSPLHWKTSDKAECSLKNHRFFLKINQLLMKLITTFKLFMNFHVQRLNI